MNIRKYIATAAIVTLSILIVNHALADDEETDVDPEVKALITPQSEISIGADYIFDDASRFGKYSGKHDDGAYAVLDLTLVKRTFSRLVINVCFTLESGHIWCLP